MENVIVAIFQDEATTYKVLSELKGRSGTSTVLEAGIIQNIAGSIVVKDGWSQGGHSSKWATGGLIGGLVGILGGPIGMLLGASLGMLVGSTVDMGDAADDSSVFQKVAEGLKDDHLALIMIAQETDYQEMDDYLNHYGAVQIVRQGVADVQAEIYQAQEAAKELRKEARKKMRAEKKAEWHKKGEGVQQDVKDDIEKVKQSK